jgi:hypothetical protein
MGHYTYVEASGSATNVSSKAYLLSPFVNATAYGYRCRLSFWYHTYGEDIDSLSLQLKRDPERVVTPFEDVWTYRPPSPGEAYHDRWHQHVVTLRPDDTYDTSLVQLRFTAAVRGPIADIALDDVMLTCNDDFEGQCVW